MRPQCAKRQHRRRPGISASEFRGHFDHGPDGNAVSTDTLVAPIRQQQWITQLQPNPWTGNPAGYKPGGGLRVWRQYAVCDDACEAPCELRFYGLLCRTDADCPAEVARCAPTGDLPGHSICEETG